MPEGKSHIVGRWKLDWLYDIDASSPSNNQVLSYNSTSGKWEARTEASIPHAMSTHSDEDTYNIATSGTIRSGELTVDSGAGCSIIIKGTSTGNANLGWIGFYDSDGTTRRGHIGDGSSSDDDIYIGADTGYLRLLAAGYISLGTHTYFPDDVVMSFGASLDYSIGYYSTDDEFQIVDGSTLDSNVRLKLDSSGHFDFGAGNLTTTGTISTPEIYNTTGDLKIQPDVQGDVTLFEDTDVADAGDGKALIVHRKAAEFDKYIKTYIDQYGNPRIDITQTGGTNLNSLFIGKSTGEGSTSATNNFAFGTSALNRTTGGFNIGIGHQAGQGVSGADFTYSVYIGNYAGLNADGGDYNFAMGNNAGRNIGNGSYNGFIGANAGRENTTGQYNYALGHNALQKNVAGHYNTAVGSYSLYRGGAVGNISNNIGIGYQSGYSCTGDGSIFIGYQAGYSETTGEKLYIANSNTATPLIYGEFDTPLLKVTGTYDVVGVTNLGDGGTTNYASFAADGELSLLGTARVINATWIDAQAIKAPTTNPAELISHETLETPAYQFANAIEGLQENVTFNMRVSNRIDRTVAPTIYIGWSSASEGNCRWQLEYLWTSPGEDTGAAAQETIPITGAAGATVDGLVQSTFTGIDLPSATDVCIHCRVTRLSADGADTLADTAEVHGVCLSWTSNKLGTATT